MHYFIIFLFIYIFSDSANGKICEPKIIKKENEIEEKLKICNRGDKILIVYDIKVNTDKLILKLCDIKYPVISREGSKIIHKRNSGLTLICIFDPSF